MSCLFYIFIKKSLKQAHYKKIKKIRFCRRIGMLKTRPRNRYIVNLTISKKEVKKFKQ